MPARGDDLTWIDISDFTPGVVSGYQVSGPDGEGIGQGAKDGAAQPRDTWAVVAMPGGGLKPAPRIVATGNGAFNTSQNVNYPQNMSDPGWNVNNATRIHDFKVYTSWPMGASGGAGVHRGGHTQIQNQPDMLNFAVEWFYSSGGQLFSRYAWYQLDLSTGATTPVKVMNETDLLGSGWPARDTIDMPQWGSSALQMIFSQFGSTPDPTQPGLPYMVWSLATPLITPPYSWTSLLGTVGDPTSGTQPNSAIYNLWPTHGGVSLPTIFRLFYHNGRLCYTAPMYNFLGGVYDYQRFLSGDTSSDNLIAYHGINNVQEHTSADIIQIGTHSVDSIGAVCSGTGGQLFLIGNIDGGTIITGSLESPTVQHFPGVEPVGFFPNTPVSTPIGVVYGSANGVFAWPGGDHSVPVGPQHEGAFWLANADGKMGRKFRFDQTPCGTFSYLYPYIYAPNSWIYDIRTSGWFRLCPDEGQDETHGIELAHFQTGHYGAVYGVQAEMRNVAGGYSVSGSRNSAVSYVRFDPGRGAGTWSWRSQPLVRGRNRRLKIREISIVASGQGVINVTVLGIDGASETQTYDLGAGYDQPTMIRQTFNVECYDPEILITASESVTDGDLRVLRLSVGFHEESSTNRT